MIVAIDGPAGAGKSTVARIVARRLSEWQQGMQANLAWIRSQVEG